jgi:pimeloyl-ACP methyl ester carboxylesterase
VTWAGDTERTPWSVVYIHGFSASRREVSPYPERLAEASGRQLLRHPPDRATGRTARHEPGDLRDWRADVAEALAIGRALGERVLAVSCSTGSTLLTLALAGGEGSRGR